MTQRTIRAWYLVHKWTSLICTAFMLMLCLTGLPLIFGEEIDALTAAPSATVASGAPMAPLDRIAAEARRAHPGDAVLYMSRDDHAPLVYVTTGSAAAPTDDGRMHFDRFDARTGARIAQPPSASGVMTFILRLHATMLLGLPGELFLGFMGLVLAAAIVSGTVIYAPFMRRLPFGTVRKTRSRRVRWLDTHNLIGIVTLAWLTVVGLTGVVNTLATPIIDLWKRDQLAEMTAAYRDAAPPARLASIDAAVRTALAAAPGTELSFIAFPGTSYSSRHHYAVYLAGATPLTRHLARPALIDAGDGRLTAIREMPLYAKALFVSQPLHFGDYGGLPLKIVWALLDVAAIGVLGSGLYLWLGRRRVPIERRLAELSSGALVEAA